MAIAFDTATTGSVAGSPTSLTFSHTNGSGSKRLLVVCIAYQDTTSATGVTYNGVAMTFVARASQNFTSSEIWYLANPSTGANNVVITMSGATSYITATANSFTGVAQTSLTDGSNTATGSSTTASVDVTTGRDNSWVIDCVAIQTNTGDITLTVGSGQTQRSNQTNSSQERQGTSTEPTTTAGTVTMDWTLSISRNWSTVGFAFKEAGTDNTLTLSQGSYSYSGFDSAIIYGRKIILAAGSYAYTGFSILLTYFQKWIPQSKNNSTETNQSLNSSSWIDQNKNTSSESNQTKN